MSRPSTTATVYASLQSPFYPLAVAAVLRAAGDVGVTPVPFAQWLLWRAHCVVEPQATEAMLAITQEALIRRLLRKPENE